MDKAKREQEVRDAHPARLVLDNPAFVEAVEAVKDECWKVFSSTVIDEQYAEKVKTARLKLDVLDGILKELKDKLNTGRMAGMQLDDGGTKH